MSGSKGGRLPNNPPESQLIKIWQHQLLDRTGLVTEEGEPIEIIYPGRINDDRGADFRDAVITINKEVVKGDIEIHVKSSDWRAHRHHYDPSYNRVILHVVMWHDTRATYQQSGKSVPVLALHKYTGEPDSQYPAVTMPCRGTVKSLTDSAASRFLDIAGEERFLTKTSRFQAELAKARASQCLYQGIMMALGYSKNEAPFLELAHRLPLRILESFAQGNRADEECLARQQAVLLGTAGLLPSQRWIGYQESNGGDMWIDKLEELWAGFCPAEAMSCHGWHLFKVRPGNFPTRRIAAMSHLIVRYRESGIFDGLVNLVRELPGKPGRLEEGLVTTTTGYWANHFDFGSGGRLRNTTTLGRNRASDIIVNVLLPFTFAWGKLTGQSALERDAIALYRGYPRLAENGVERHMMSQLGLSRNLVNSARRQQGLIHIYKTLCTQGKCRDCQLSRI